MNQTALQRIKEIEGYSKEGLSPMYEDAEFLLKAFNVMRKIAQEKLDDCEWIGDLDEYFEDRMSK